VSSRYEHALRNIIDKHRENTMSRLISMTGALVFSALFALPAQAELMKLISRNVRAIDSNNSTLAVNANGASPSPLWSSNVVPAWLAYDLSTVPTTERQDVLVVLHTFSQDYYSPTSADGKPVRYTIESNTAPGGGSVPTTGWTILATAVNEVSTPHHLLRLSGANWIRVNISQSNPASFVQLDMDIFHVPAGADDSWLFMGDSITAMTLSYLGCDIPARVNQLVPSRWPQTIDAALGGTAANATTAGYVDTYLTTFPGRYVVLAYGTNNHPIDFDLEPHIQKVIAAGRIPVVPHIPWSDQKLVEGPQINAMIDALYAKYPQIMRGPDFWTLLQNTALIPSGDVHPTAQGQVVIRQAWAQVMSTVNAATNRCDLNGDNFVDIADVQLSVNQAIRVTSCTTGNVNGDNDCNILDVQRVVNAVLGSACLSS
jgi:hypothetical protein